MSFTMAASIVTTIMVDQKKDKTAAEADATFEVHQKRLLLDRRTLFIFDHTFKIRKAVVWLTEWKWFERFIILCICVNSVCLAIADYKTRLAAENFQSNRERELGIIDNVLTAIFIAEFVLKLISRGAFMHRTAYLKDPWNWLDFFVVVISILGLFKLGNKGLRALRTFRILRPLKTINAVPRIRAQINVLILSIPGLMNTLLFLTFIFMIFSILGSQSFAGGQYKHCRMTQEPLIVRDESNKIVSYSWPIVDTFNNLCRDDNSCKDMIKNYGPEDLQVYKCGQSIDYGVSAAGPTFYDKSDLNEDIYYDIVNFNNVGNGLLVIFQTLTLEGWTTLMYNYMDSQSYVTSIFFFITLTLLGSFFMLNLVLATIIESFYEQKKKQVSEVLDIIQESKLTKQMNTDNIAGQLNSEISEQAQSQSLLKHHQTTESREANIFSPAALKYESNSPEISNHSEQDISRPSKPNSNQQITKKADLSTDRIDKPKGLEPTSNAYSTGGRSANSHKQTPSKDNIELEEKGVQSESSSLEGPYEMTTGKIFKRASSFQKAKTRDQLKSPRVQFDLPPSSPSDDKEEDSEPFKKDKTRLCSSERMEPEERSQENIIFMLTYQFVCHWLFQFIIFLLIIGNTLSLASFSYPMSQHKEDVLYRLNVFFTWAFTFEMIVKLIGFGPNNYRKDYFNLFDALLVILSLIDWGLTLPSHLNNEIQSSDGGLLKVFRALRLLRIIKLARRWTGLQKIIKKTAESALDILTFAVLLFLFVFIFALLGMEFFAFRVRIDLNTDQIIPYSELQERFDQDPTSLVPIRENFDSIGRAMTTVFSIITLEDWQWRLFNHIQPFPRKYSTPITIGFIFCICIGSFTLLSLFTAILLQNFEALAEEEEEEENEETYRQLQSFQSPTKVYEKKKSILAKKKTMRQQQSKFFSMATWNKFSFEFIKIFDLRQQHITLNQVAVKNASPVSGEGSPGSISNFDNYEGSKPNQEEQNIEIKDQEQDQIQGQNNEIKLVPIIPSEESPNSRNLFKTNSTGSLKILIRKSSSNFNTGMNVLEMTTVVLPHLLYNSLVTEKLSSLDLAKFQSEAVFTDIYGTSLFLFTRTNKFRLLVTRLVKMKAFDYCILALIAISTINLAFDTPLRDPMSKLIIVLTKIDYFMTAVFTTEAILKIIAYGLTTPKYGYLRNPWNLLDATVVFFSLLAIALEKVPLLQVIKIVRVVRVLRPLRVVSKHKGLQIAITSLIKSMPGIINLQLVVFFVITMLSILHTFIFYGRMGSCQTDKLSFSPTHLIMLIKTKQDCINYGGEWKINDFNFNNFGRSFLTLFTIQTQENWIETMWTQVDGTGPDQAPITDHNSAIVFLCIGTNMILSLLFLNLFVGVVVETYNFEKERQSLNLYLHESQRQWIDVQLMAYSVKPEAELTETNFKFRKLLRQLVKRPAFEYFIMACIFGNTIVLCISWYGIGKEIVKITDYFNYTFMAIFAMEAMVKIIALDKHYFYEKWNIFDFVVVITTAFVVILESLNIGSIGKQASILRSLRILRVLRIFKKFKRLQIIFRTLTDAAPSMGSLGLLLLLLIFIYAILGMQLFGYTSIKNQIVMDQHVNFQTFTSSVLLLLRCTTGESWNQIMFDCARQRSLLFQCHDKFDYSDYVISKHTNKCGSPTAAYIYFITFVLIVTQIFLNIFIAIAVDSFLVQVERGQLLVSENHIEQFVMHWKAFDPSGSGFIPTSKLELLILELCKDDDCDLIYLKDPMIKRPKVRSIMISKMSIPTYDRFQHVYFYDVLLCLCKEKLENEYDRDKGLLHKEKIKFLQEMEKTLVRENQDDDSSKNMLAKTRNLIKEELKRNQISENQLQSERVTSEYTKMLQGLKDINPKVERVQKLHQEAKSKHKKCIVREVDLFENKDKKVFYYTTSHYIYGNILKKGLRLFINRKNENKKKSLADIIRANEMLQIKSVLSESVSDLSTVKADVVIMKIIQPEGLSAELTAIPEKQTNDSQVKSSSQRKIEDQIDTLEADNTNQGALKLVRDYKTTQIMNEFSP